jgi:hypothetical protein
MRKSLLAAIVVMTVFQWSPAFAWWTYAKWGFTRDQLVRASGGKAYAKDGKPYLYLDGVASAGLNGTAEFSFDGNGRLVKTTLVFTEVYAAHHLKEALSSVYGRPVSAEGGPWPVTQWRDEAKGTAIRLREGLANSTLVEYVPIAKGL